MFCPQCGVRQGDEMRFCKSCGANLQAVRQAAIARGETEEMFDWGKTWVGEMFMSASERERRQAEIDRQRGLTPEIKRYNEIKAGVITGCVGIGVAIFLYFLMQGIILSGEVSPGEAQILSRVWLSGLIPMFVGLALIINGTFVSKRMVEVYKQGRPDELAGARERALPEADTTEFVSTNFSVTEDTTRHLEHADRARKSSPGA